MNNLTKALMAAWALTGSAVLQGQAFSVPRSDEVIQVEIVLPGGAQAKAEVRDGSLLTIRNDAGGGYLYGFAMAVDAKSKRAAVTSVEIFDLPGGGQRVSQFGGPEDLMSGSPLEVETSRGIFQFRLINIVTGKFPSIRPLKSPLKSGVSPSQLQAIYGKSGGGTCCVSCASITICANQVDMTCGSCDSGGRSFPVQ
jgi:hypothetical protein